MIFPPSSVYSFSLLDRKIGHLESMSDKDTAWEVKIQPLQKPRNGKKVTSQKKIRFLTLWIPETK